MEQQPFFTSPSTCEPLVGCDGNGGSTTQRKPQTARLHGVMIAGPRNMVFLRGLKEGIAVQFCTGGGRPSGLPPLQLPSRMGWRKARGVCRKTGPLSGSSRRRRGKQWLQPCTLLSSTAPRLFSISLLRGEQKSILASRLPLFRRQRRQRAALLQLALAACGRVNN